ncbi:hypothetical protein [Nocardioides bruguierae]|uniref:Lipoprotein n=1 Tax=Nocardioides bruguierae TaxID=2945102 RepID=A0A9X2DBK7_9ACTN|nr:hypothetical protein [Nocardioides bruguierae]MCM0622818.1 hypothetical protein [Nocardioides bruguierae]
MMKLRSVIPVFSISLLMLGACSSDDAVPSAKSVGSDGPMVHVSPHGWAEPVQVGQTISDGLEVLYLENVPSDATAVITNVSLIGDDALELVDAYIVPGPRKVGSFILPDQWPPVEGSRLTPVLDPAIGASIGTRSASDDWGWLLVIGMRSVQPGYKVRSGIRIDYEYLGTEYFVNVPGVVGMCVSSKPLKEGAECAIPKIGEVQ